MRELAEVKKKPLFKDTTLLEAFCHGLGALVRRVLWFAGTLYWRHNCGGNTSGCQFGWPVRIRNPRRVIFSSKALVGSGCVLTNEGGEGKLHIGAGVVISDGCTIDYTGGLELGDNAYLSPGVQVSTHSHGYDPRGEPKPSPLRIGEGVWIGLRTLVLPGVTEIGSNSVLGAGSVVTHDVPPDSIVAGCPARAVSNRRSLDVSKKPGAAEDNTGSGESG